jgi:hypothetical protein
MNCIVFWTHSIFNLIIKTIFYYIQSIMALWCKCVKILDQKFVLSIRNNRLLDKMAMVSLTNSWNKMVMWNFASHTMGNCWFPCHIKWFCILQFHVNWSLEIYVPKGLQIMKLKIAFLLYILNCVFLFTDHIQNFF